MAATMLRKLGTLTRSKRPKSDLWVRIKGQKMKSPYHCVWPSFCESRPDIQWACLTTHEVTYPHVRLYTLSGEDSITMFVSFLEQLSSVPATMAIVLINTEESYDLDAKFSTGHHDVPVPVVIVKKKTGDALMKLVERYSRDLEASIEGGKEEEGKTDTVGRKGKDKGKTKTAAKEKGSPTSQHEDITFPSPHMKDDSTHELCVRVKVKEEGEYERHSFQFTLGGLSQSLPSINWVSLTSSETTFPHVCIHELEEEDNLSYFSATLSSIPAARAMILVNPKSTYELSMKFRSSEESPPVPLFVVTRETGAELLRLVGEYPRAVEVRVGVSDHTGGRPQSLELENRASLFAGPEAQGTKPVAGPAVADSSPCPPVVVKNGLKIRLKSEATSTCREFDYVAAPFSVSLRSIDWADLTTSEATYPHVRLYELRAEEDENLAFFMSTMASITATMAIVLVNSENDFTFSKKFHSEEQAPPVPVVMVTKETGMELLKLSRENFREVEARVELSPDKNAQPISSPSTPSSWAVCSTSPPSRSLSQSIVKKGLKVRLKSVSSQQYEFDYMSAPFALSLRSVNWVDLTSGEATYPHIRLHELTEDDSLTFFMSMLASIPATLAVVLTNTHDGYDLSKKFSSSEEQGCPVPMLVVTRETGREIARLVQENSRAIEARVDLSPDAVKSHPSPALSSPSPLVSPETAARRRGHHVNKGLLHVRVTGNPELNRDFEYSWAAFNQSARPLDWIALTTTETTFQHVRLHQLTRDDSLSYFMATLSSIPAARAIILINTENSHLLSAKKLNLGGGGGGEQCFPVPVLVVMKEMGAELLRLVAEYPRGVEVKVDVSNGTMSTQSSWSELAMSPAVSYHKKGANHRIIKGGLELHIGKKLQSYRFDYGWGTFNQSSVRQFQKMPLTLYETTYTHVRLHKLTREDSLKFFMSMMASIPATMAVILINFDNSYRLSEKFVSEGENAAVPMVLVTNETGLQLMKLLEETPRDVEVTIHSQDHHQPSHVPAEPREAVLPSVTGSPEDGFTKGLHVKIGFMGAVLNFEYAPGPFRQEIPDIDWVCVTASETTFPHIRIHDLRQEDSLSFFMSTMASTPAALAIVFVNSENTFRLAEKFQSEEQSPPVPVLVVTKDTGRELLRLVKENPRNVFVKVDQLSLHDVVERGGLQIQLTNKKPLPPACFDFTWAKFNQTPRSIDWRPLALQEVTFPHIRLHHLHDRDGLADFLSMMDSIPATLAVVLINTENDYRLPETVACEGQSPPVPVVVVSRATGDRLVQLIQDNPRDVEARIDTVLKGLMTPNASVPTSPNLSLFLSIGAPGPGLVKRGMEVRLPTEETKYFDYAWPTFCNSPRSLDWMGVARHQVTYPHVQIHELKYGESIAFFLSTLGSMTAAKALILVNVYDGFKLDEKFHPKSEGPCVPTLVVPRKTGVELMEMVRVYGREVQVRFHTGDGGDGDGGEGVGVGEGEEGTMGDPDEWDVIQSPLAEDVPSFSSLVESITTYTAIKDGLLIKSKRGRREKTSKFDYVWATFCSARRQIDWTKLVLSTSVPKSMCDYVCLHDLQKDKSRTLYTTVLQSSQVKALVLINTCNSYKVPHEFHYRTEMSVLVVTKSTGEALIGILRDPTEARVEFGGLDRDDREWFPATGNEGMQLEWEDSFMTRPVGEGEPVQDTEKHNAPPDRTEPASSTKEERKQTESNAEIGVQLGMSGRGVGERAELGRRGVMVDEKGTRDSERRETQKGGMEGGLRTEPKTCVATGGSGITREGERRNELPPHSTTTATGTAVTTPALSDTELEQSIAEFMLVETPDDSTPTHQHKTTPIDTQQDTVSLTPTPSTPPGGSLCETPPAGTPPGGSLRETPPAGTPPGGSLRETPPAGTPPGGSLCETPPAGAHPGGSLCETPPAGTPPGGSLCEPPTMLPLQEMVPYNPEPYTGDDILHTHTLSDVAGRAPVSHPGDHVTELLPHSSHNIDWRKPITNGLQVRPVEHQDSTPQYFTYQWSHVTDSPQKLDWITITERDNCPEEHIRLYQLTKYTDLQLLMATADPSSAAALLIINNKNSLEIDRSFFPRGDDVWPVPVLVVTSDTGKRLKGVLSSCSSGEAEALVEIEPRQVSTPEVSRGRMTSFLKGLIGGGTD